MDAKEALELRRRQILERLSPEALEIQPGYHTAREELIRPDRQETDTAYFWDRWAPRLGPAATVLVVRMRQACRRAGVAQDRDARISLSYAEIGRLCGLSASTIKRLLNEEEVRRFLRKEAQMRESTIGMVDAPNRYTVMMTDPLLPEDDERLRLRLADRLLTQELLGQQPRAHRGAVQNEPVPPAQIDPVTPAQNEQATPNPIGPASRDQPDPPPPRKRASIMAARTRPDPAAAVSPRPNADSQNVRTHEEPNVNVLTPNDAPHYVPNEAVESWAFRMVELTGDEKSINFYRKAARVLIQRNAEGVLDHATGLVKEAIRLGTARRPAALLTSTILTLAEERGIFITERNRREAEQVRSLIRGSLARPNPEDGQPLG